MIWRACLTKRVNTTQAGKKKREDADSLDSLSVDVIAKICLDNLTDDLTFRLLLKHFKTLVHAEPLCTTVILNDRRRVNVDNFFASLPTQSHTEKNKK